MPGRASPGQVKSLALQVGDGVPSDIAEMDAARNLGDMSRIHEWLRLGLISDLSRVNMTAVEALVRPNILYLVATTTIPALPAFDVAAHFRVMTGEERRTAEVPIGWMNDDAQRIVKGLVEADVVAATLRRHNLLRNSLDAPIITELGGEDDITLITTRWAQMYEMMKAQGRGQEGDLLVNGYANIFYVPDKNGVVWAVNCYWDSGGRCWIVDADPVTAPNTWYAGNQVVSR